MNNVFSLKNEKSWKSVYVTADKLLLINKSYSDPEAFMKGYEDDGLGRLLKQKKDIPVFGITGLQHPEKNPSQLTIQYEGKKVTLQFARQEDLQEVAAFLAAERKLDTTTQQLSTFKAIQSPLVALAVTLGLGYLLFAEAQTIEAGGIIEITGRRQGVKRLMAWLAETLGTNGVLICAGAVVLVCVFFIYRNMKTPPNQVTYA